MQLALPQAKEAERQGNRNIQLRVYLGSLEGESPPKTSSFFMAWLRRTKKGKDFRGPDSLVNLRS